MCLTEDANRKKRYAVKSLLRIELGKSTQVDRSSSLLAMNALYTHALRQTQSITSDLSLLEGSLKPLRGNGEGTSYSASPSPSLQGNGIDAAGLNGQIVASLAALQRTVDDYENMARRELVEANKGKAAKSVVSTFMITMDQSFGVLSCACVYTGSRAERIRSDYSELKKQYDSLKQTQAAQVRYRVYARGFAGITLRWDAETHLGAGLTLFHGRLWWQGRSNYAAADTTVPIARHIGISVFSCTAVAEPA